MTVIMLLPYSVRTSYCHILKLKVSKSTKLEIKTDKERTGKCTRLILSETL